MDKAITTALMLIVSVVVSVMVFNTVYPAVNQSSAALVGMRGRIDDRLKSQVEIIHATGELDKDGAWQDINGNGTFDIFVWVKNVGATRIIAVQRMDLFLGPEGNFIRIPYKDDAGGSYPYWEWQVENDTAWNPTATLKITVRYGSLLSSGRYFVKLTLPNGLSDSFFFSM
ncbi:hypothetical protein FKZ61_014880 [Litorilinea aerophila]|uniref:Uncharacterized protein n=1 Tax=Litorilinea aerophila TaxID=1204385 RepID=A0A540VDN1_9CHLR|nr:hypothetical protein [Litorilinea aerophila]MCC9077388.1 hypothetical protein [Litorilinea aerophila]